MLDKKKVICGISGGVDSSAACIMLKNMGYEVIALYISMWNEDSTKGSIQLEAARKCAREAELDDTERSYLHDTPLLFSHMAVIWSLFLL